jgi:hypothetical protein
MPVRSTIMVHLRFEDLLNIPPEFFAKTWSNTSMERPRFKDSHFEDFKFYTPKLIPKI